MSFVVLFSLILLIHAPNVEYVCVIHVQNVQFCSLEMMPTVTNCYNLIDDKGFFLQTIFE